MLQKNIININNMQKSKGFTIIELVVVIAIIGILAAIVLINVSSYINKSKDATIQADLHTIQTAMISTNAQSTTWADATTSDYTGAVTQIGNNGGKYLENLGTSAWCARSTLPSGATAWCVDSTGYAGILPSGGCTGASYACGIAGTCSVTSAACAPNGANGACCSGTCASLKCT